MLGGCYCRLPARMFIWLVVESISIWYVLYFPWYDSTKYGLSLKVVFAIILFSHKFFSGISWHTALKLHTIQVDSTVEPLLYDHPRWSYLLLLAYVSHISRPVDEPGSRVLVQADNCFYARRRPVLCNRDGRSWGIRIRTETIVRLTKCGRMRGVVVGAGGRSSGVLLYSKVRNRNFLVKFNIILLQYAKGIRCHQ